jgi:hypothetical protein
LPGKGQGILAAVLNKPTFGFLAAIIFQQTPLPDKQEGGGREGVQKIFDPLLSRICSYLFFIAFISYTFKKGFFEKRATNT